MTTNQTNMIRLQKWISELGITSRREAERWIQEGRVAINGDIVTTLGTKVNPEEDRLTIDGKAVDTLPPPRVYWLLHKPDKTLTALRSEDDRPTIFDLPKLRKVPFLVSPVGRLDYRTEGLLLLSNDGELVHRLTHPKYKVPRHYQALITGKLSDQELSNIRAGFDLEDGPVKNVKVQYAHGKNLGHSRGSWYFVTVHEGRNRLVRRIFEHFGHKVVRLVRYGFGELRLPEDLAPGDYRQLTSEEVKILKGAAGLVKE